METSMLRSVMIVAIALGLVSCGQPPGRDRQETPLSADERNWQQYGVYDPQSLDWMNMHNNTRMERSDSLAMMVRQYDRITDAVVIRTDLHAYVGIKRAHSLDARNIDVADGLKAKITLALKTADSKLVNVYVSGRPDVYDTLKKYASKLANGVSERNLVESFNTRMQQQFAEGGSGR